MKIVDRWYFNGGPMIQKVFPWHESSWQCYCHWNQKYHLSRHRQKHLTFLALTPEYLGHNINTMVADALAPFGTMLLTMLEKRVPVVPWGRIAAGYHLILHKWQMMPICFKDFFAKFNLQRDNKTHSNHPDWTRTCMACNFIKQNVGN